MDDTDRYTRRTMLVAVGGTGAALLAGCGGPGEEDDEEPENDVDDEAWEDVEEFRFEGRVEAWTGVEPDIIDGEENPTITLIEGQEYDFTWVNADGVEHNLEIRDGDDEVVDDYQSDDVEQEGEEASIEGVVATEEMAVYICQYHETTQVGDVEVRTE